MERGGQSLVQRDLIRNQESEIGVEMVGCNIPVFVDIEKPSISFGLYIMIQDWDACKNAMYISIQQLMIATKGVNSSYTMDISSNSISFIPLRERGIP
jgi:hypothetical protein